MVNDIDVAFVVEVLVMMRVLEELSMEHAVAIINKEKITEFWCEPSGQRMVFSCWVLSFLWGHREQFNMKPFDFMIEFLT